MNKKTILTLSGLLLLATFLFIGPYILLNLPFEYGGDLKPSWFAFYSEIQNLVSLRKIFTQFTLPFYSWDMFLGNNYWASKGFYGLFDPFNYLTLWLPVHFYVVFEIHVVLKTLIAGLSFFAFIQYLNPHPKANIITSLSYALSSWAIFYIGQMTFASFYALVPLYFLGIELYLKEQKKYLFILSSVLLLFINYYLFFSLSLFTVLYYLYRYYLIHGSFKHVVKKTSILIGFYVIAALITMLVTLPTFLYMMGSDRVGGFIGSLNLYTFKIYFHELLALFVPSHLYIYDSNAFETGLHNTREIFFWASSLNALLIPQVLTDKDKAFKKATLIAYFVIGLILAFPLLASIMHGFSESSFRWTYLVILFSLTVSSRYLSDLSKINLKTLKYTLFTFFILTLIVLPLNLYFDDKLQLLFSTFSKLIVIYVIAFIYLGLITWLLIKKPKHLYSILIAVTFIELSAYGFYNLFYARVNPDYTWEFTNRATHVLQSYPNELNTYLNDLDGVNESQYYRVYVPHESLYWSYSHNMAIHYQLQGLMTYDSTYSPSFNDLKQIAPQVKDFESNWIFNIKDPNLVDFFNVKYAIVVDESELPHKDFTLITNEYRGSLQIYSNDLYRALGTTYNQVLSYEQLAQKNNSTVYFNTHIIAKEKDMAEIKTYLTNTNSSSLENITYYDNQLHGTIKSDDVSFMVLSLPYDLGWKILVNNQEVPVYQVNGGMMGFPILAGDNQIDLYFIPYGFKTGVVLSGLGILGLFLIFVLDKKKASKH